MDATLLKKAMLGTDKGRHVEGVSEGRVDAIESLMEGIAPESPSWNLLLKAGCYAVAERAGYIPDVVPENRQDARAPAETLPCISARMSEIILYFLKERLDQPHVPLHFLRQIDKAGLRLSFESLPGCLHFFSQRRHFKESERSTVLAVLGERGRWLAAQHKDWQWASGSVVDKTTVNVAELESLWNEGHFQDRVQALRQWRDIDSAQARDQLAASWKNEKPEHRETFLDVLREQLNDGDVSFLEGILSDRSKPVRQSAATMLALLPDSDYAKRTVHRAEALLKPDAKSNALQIEPPAAFTKEMKADAIEEKPPKGVGEKSWQVTELLRRVRLTHWETRFQLSPTAILAALAKDDYYSSFLYAATYIVQWFDDHDHWLEPLWDAWESVKPKTVSEALDVRNALFHYCLKRLPEKFIAKLNDRKGSEHLHSYIIDAWFNLALKTPIPWDDAFVQSLLLYIKDSSFIIRFVNGLAPFFPKHFYSTLSALLEKLEQKAAYYAKDVAACRDELAYCEEFERLLADYFATDIHGKITN
ncbi:MAG: DUF5691 domain-containing protein [Planctomycetaceae bacterium]|nr:DUF5691 domain-containing protein [Planctomycetaceae bacterium]